MNTAFLLLPDFILILIAWGISRYTPLRQSVWESLEQLVYWVLFPCLLFNSAIHAKLVWADNLPMILLLGTCMCTMGALAYSAKWLFNPDPINLVSGIQTTFRFNTYMVLAVSSRMLDAAGLELMAITIAFLVPISNVLSVLSLAHRSSQSLMIELLKNPFVLATIAGLLCNFLGVHLPDAIEVNLSRLGNASITLGLMTVGASLKWVSTKKDGVLIFYWVFLKLIALPAMTLVGATLFHLPPAQKLNAVLFACMPTATSAYVMTNRMGGNGAIVAVTISIMTLLAALTIPMWIHLIQVYS